MDYLFEFYLLEAELENVADEKAAKKYLQTFWKRIKDLVPAGERLKTYKTYISSFLDKYRVYEKANPSELKTERERLVRKIIKLEKEYGELTSGGILKKLKAKASIFFTDNQIAQLHKTINETKGKLKNLDEELKSAQEAGYSWNKRKIAIHLAIISAVIVVLTAIIKYIKSLANEK